MADKSCDVIIIGAGPAGLSAAIYTSRELLSTLVLEKSACGGLVMMTDVIENYPGFPEGIRGVDLMENFKKQAGRFGAKIQEYIEVNSIESKGDAIWIKAESGEYFARAVIIASGSVPKKLDIPGEEKYTGKGVSYCATCDGPLFKDKNVIVMGGGNTAVEEALFLTKFASSVTLIHRRGELRASKILQERLRQNEKIKFLLDHVAVSINGEKFVNSITVKDNKTGSTKNISASGVFIYVGFTPNSDFLKGKISLDETGYVKTDDQMSTSVPGIYAAGDIRSKKVRQIAVASAEGIIAAVSVRDYLR